MDDCRVLMEYTEFIEKVREYQQNNSEKPIEEAMNYCIDKGILADFLRERYDEVLKSMILDMTFENREHMIRRDSREEGRAEGRLEALFELYVKGILDKTVAIESSNLSEEMFDEALKNYNKTI